MYRSLLLLAALTLLPTSAFAWDPFDLVGPDVQASLEEGVLTLDCRRGCELAVKGVGSRVHVFTASSTRPTKGCEHGQIAIPSGVKRFLTYGRDEVQLIRFYGSRYPDALRVSELNVRVEAYGSGGDDHLLADVSGELHGGDGKDCLVARAGGRLYGNDNDDELRGEGAWAYLMEGGDGGDILIGGTGNDVLRGGDGRDSISGGEGDDLLEGGDADDDLYGDEGDDLLKGGDGSDDLEGGPGHDEMRGDRGDDEFKDTEGVNVALGGRGKDWIEVMGAGSYVSGGGGVDRCYYGDAEDVEFDRCDRLRSGAY